MGCLNLFRQPIYFYPFLIPPSMRLIYENEFLLINSKFDKQMLKLTISIQKEQRVTLKFLN